MPTKLLVVLLQASQGGLDASNWGHPHLSLPPVGPSEFHGVDPSTVPHIDDDPDWVNAPIPVPTPVFQTPSTVADRNPINNQLAKAL